MIVLFLLLILSIPKTLHSCQTPTNLKTLQSLLEKPLAAAIKEKSFSLREEISSATKQEKRLSLASKEGKILSLATQYLPKNPQNAQVIDLLRNLPDYDKTKKDDADYKDSISAILLITGLLMPEIADDVQNLSLDVHNKNLDTLTDLPNLYAFLSQKGYVLHHINATYNKLADLSFDHSAMPHVKILDISHNPIKTTNLYNFKGNEEFHLWMHGISLNFHLHTHIAEQLWPAYPDSTSFIAKTTGYLKKSFFKTISASCLAAATLIGLCTIPLRVAQKKLPINPYIFFIASKPFAFLFNKSMGMAETIGKYPYPTRNSNHLRYDNMPQDFEKEPTSQDENYTLYPYHAWIKTEFSKKIYEPLVKAIENT